MGYLDSVQFGANHIKTKTAAVISAIAIATSSLGMALAVPLTAHAATCTPTGFVRDSINLTAALINPGNVSNKTVNATGCNIGVYYGPGAKGTVQNSEVFGANYYGIVNDGGKVNVQNSNVHDIGDVPFNGTQHGVGIYFSYDTGASGTIQNNTVSRYQKGGITVNGGSDTATIQNNTVTGLGRVNFIAQNGIQVGFGAQANVQNNNVSGNAYTGANDAFSAGILVFGGCGDPMVTNATVQNNTLTNNDVGIYVVNTPVDDCSNPPTTPTKDKIQNNTITNDAITNISGNGGGVGYQAGITEYGNSDVIQNNHVSGVGYTSPSTPAVVIVPIDTTGSVNVKLQNNSVN